MTDAPFAYISDLTARWRALTPEEELQAEVLIDDASQIIIDEGFPVATIAPETLTRIVCAMVKRAMAGPDFGVESVQQGAGPFQSTLRYSNPLGDLYLTKSERRALGGGRQRAFEIDLLGGV